MVPALVELALEYYRKPLRYSHLADVARPLPRGFDDMLTAFGAALSPSQIAQTAEALSTDRDELERAARFFIRHVLLDPGGDYYRYLGLTRRAPPEAIRNHYLLLIRMFHPDRLAEANEADLAYSSRINAAYHVLRDAQARKDYDCGLPKGLRQTAGSDPRTFFRPTGPVLSSPRSRLFERLGSTLRRPSVVVAASLSLVALLGYLLLEQVGVQPTLRMTGSDSGGHARVAPSYLKRATEQPVEVAPNDEPDQVSGSDQPQPRQPAPQHETRGTRGGDSATSLTKKAAAKVGPAPADANALVGLLEHAYRQGDANALAALFAEEARTSDGSGQELIRNLYAGFFRRSIEGQLSVRGLQWQPGSDGRLIGRGQVSVSNRYRGATAWQRSRGRIQIEVADGPEGYRITEMFYQLD